MDKNREVECKKGYKRRREAIKRIGKTHKAEKQSEEKVACI